MYDALDERGAKNRVALKIMLPGLAQSQSLLNMFRGEAIRVTSLNHPNIVDWKSFDCTPDGRYYFVMELLDGQSLDKLLEAEGTLDWKAALKIMLQILAGLRAAHFVAEGQSILHLDLSPRNILISPERRSSPLGVKLIDFGIGQYLG
ncbi:MAG: serine/threonine protein kinase, partial [Planctomycetota bacterium]